MKVPLSYSLSTLIIKEERKTQFTLFPSSCCLLLIIITIKAFRCYMFKKNISLDFLKIFFVYLLFFGANDTRQPTNLHCDVDLYYYPSYYSIIQGFSLKNNVARFLSTRFYEIQSTKNKLKIFFSFHKVLLLSLKLLCSIIVILFLLFLSFLHCVANPLSLLLLFISEDILISSRFL